MRRSIKQIHEFSVFQFMLERTLSQCLSKFNSKNILMELKNGICHYYGNCPGLLSSLVSLPHTSSKHPIDPKVLLNASRHREDRFCSLSPTRANGPGCQGGSSSKAPAFALFLTAITGNSVIAKCQLPWIKCFEGL